MGAVGTSTSGGTTALEGKEELPKGKSLENESQVDKLRESMGQTGLEAGDPDARPREKLYVNTGKAFNINTYLATDGETYYSPDSNWNDLIDEKFIKDAIPKIDSGMRPLTTNISVTRFIDGDAFGKMIGDSDMDKESFRTMLSKLDTSDKAKSDFTTLLKGIQYTHKGYTSTSYENYHGSYGDRDIVLNMVARQGTSAIITKNAREHEILLSRNLKYRFTGGWSLKTSSSGRKQIVLDVYV